MTSHLLGVTAFVILVVWVTNRACIPQLYTVIYTAWRATGKYEVLTKVKHRAYSRLEKTN